MRGVRAKAERKAGKRKQPRHKRFNERAFRAVLASKKKDALLALARDAGLSVTSRTTMHDATERLVAHHRNAARR